MAEEERKKPDVVVMGVGKIADDTVRIMSHVHPGKTVMVVDSGKGDNFFEGLSKEDAKLILGAMSDFERPKLDVRKVAELKRADYFGVENSGREKRVSRRKKLESKFSDEVRKKLRSR